MVSERQLFTSSEQQQAKRLDAVVVGAGIGGLYMLYKLRELGLSAKVFDDAPEVGGTWYWNRYPGARCDIPSMVYSYSFSEEIQQEWTWSEQFASQPEILRYLKFVADRLDLRRDIELETRVEAAWFNEKTRLWEVRTNRGDALVADYCIMATGNLSAPNVPKIEGIEGFEGKIYHSARWPEAGVDLAGKRVGVIGTGSTGIQIIQTIASEAESLTVFQRTPSYSIPAKNRALTPERTQEIKANYAEIRRKSFAHFAGTGYIEPQFGLRQLPEDERDRRYEENWNAGGPTFMSGFPELWFNKVENDVAADFIRGKIRQIVRDQNVATMLSPTDYYVGTKRICLDSNYYETFNRPNVSLVDLRKAPIEVITAGGVKTSDKEYPLDVLVFATGFDAITGALIRIDIRGRNGVTLQQKWSGGPRTYLGLASEGFPNLFIMNGPATPSPLANFFVAIEQNVNWIANCITYQRENGIATLEATRGAEDDWMQHVADVASKTLFPTANSWFIGANIPGKPRQFMVYVGGFPAYAERCAAVATSHYEGFNVERESELTSA